MPEAHWHSGGTELETGASATSRRSSGLPSAARAAASRAEATGTAAMERAAMGSGRVARE